MKQLLLIGAALAAIPLTALLAQPQPAAPGLTPEQIVAARQSSYVLSGGSFAAMKAAADSGADVRTLAFPARSLARWARTLPTLFPAGTNLPGSHALPAVWSDRAGFEARAAAYATAAQALAQAAQSGDRAAFLTQWAAVRQTCSACHETYKASD
ncbi:MAG: cytochrome c [Alphaproteobacteria bacterium]|nr:MAG: cytochrome c [Alphaproteobacteria bacterium]